MREAWSRFLTVTPKFFTIEDNHMQIMAASLLEENDVILFVSYSGSTRDAEDVLRPAKARGAKIVLITHYATPLPPAWRTWCCCAAGSRTPAADRGALPPRWPCCSWWNMLVNEFCRRDMDTTMRNKDLTANALAIRHL